MPLKTNTIFGILVTTYIGLSLISLPYHHENRIHVDGKPVIIFHGKPIGSLKKLDDKKK